MKKLLISTLIFSSLVSQCISVPVFSAEDTTALISYKYGDVTYTRKMEKLDRGLVAVKTSDGVFLSWRLNGDESSVEDIISAPNFNVYRDGKFIDTVSDSTNYVDRDGKLDSKYSVAPVMNGTEGGHCGEVSVNENNYFDINLNKPDAASLPKTVSEGKSVYFVDNGGNYLSDWRESNVAYTDFEYTVGDSSCGDVDGDGEYEIIVKWDCNPQDNSFGGVTGNVYLDAYKQDGTMLWRIDLGKNIRAGAHYTQFLVYDFDGDGKAEITCKTAPGSVDGNGDYVTEASDNPEIQSADNDADYRNGGGYILDGPEYFTIFKGETGEAIDTIDYPVQRINAQSWGDTYGNRCDRYIADVAYLDGEKPYAVYWRGYYGGKDYHPGRTGIAGISFDGERLSCDYMFDTLKGQEGYTSGNEIYIGQGNHNMTVADVDNDGKDEFLSGALCMEVDDSDNISVKWFSERGHGDALHIGDYDPTHDGLEYFSVHEGGGYKISNSTTGTNGLDADYGMTVYDAATGEELFHKGASGDTGRGVMANIGSGGYYQFWGSGAYTSQGNNTFDSSSLRGVSYNFRIFWDGDLYDELLDGTTIASWNGRRMSNIFTADECVQINGTKANPALQADIFGDWREEVLFPLADNSALRVYTTTEVTKYKLPTLMHDPVYRSGVAAEQTAYNQPPHIGYYLSEDIYKAKFKDISVTFNKTEYNVGENIQQEDLTVTAYYTDGTSYDVTDYAISGYNKYAAGSQEITVSYMGHSDIAEINVNTGFTVDSEGYLNGYTGSSKSEIIPDSINGIPVIGIRAHLFDGASSIPISSITVRDNIKDIEENKFEGIKIYCYEGSYMHEYAFINALDYEIIDRQSNDYTINETFEEEEYDSLNMIQLDEDQSENIRNILYNVDGRSNNGGGDKKTGFIVTQDNDGRILKVGIGQFAIDTRAPYMNINNPILLSADRSVVFSTDVYIPYTKPDDVDEPLEPKIEILDDSSVIDTISISELNIEHDTWYKYELTYQDGKYYRTIYNKDGNIVLISELNSVPSSYSVSQIRFSQESGNFREGKNTYLYLDNTQLYSTDAEISNAEFTIKDNRGNPIKNAEISVAGLVLKTDSNGKAETIIPYGLYDIKVSTENFEQTTVKTVIYDKSITKDITLPDVTIPVQGITLSKTELNMSINDSELLKAALKPGDATNKNVLWSSSNEGAVEVNNGIVTAVAEGSSVITATTEDGGFTASCEVKVYDSSKYQPIPTTLKISVPEKGVYIPVTGTNTMLCTAEVYDQNGVEIKDSVIEWSCDDDFAQINNGLLLVPSTAQPDFIYITAVSGMLSDTVSVRLKSILNPTSSYIDETYDEEFTLLQTGTGTSDIHTSNNITYVSGSRKDKGEEYTGLLSKDGFLYALAGEWSTHDRNAYITFDGIPEEYLESEDYVFETDIQFSENAVAVLSNNKTEIIKLTSSSLGIENDVMYKYKFIYSGGKYYQAIFSEDGGLISFNEISVFSDLPLNRIDFLRDGKTNVQIKMDNTKYYSTENAFSEITIKVKDEDDYISGANVNIGNINIQTNERGIAVLTLPVGIYAANVSVDGKEIAAIKITADKLKKEYTVSPISTEIKSVIGKNIFITSSKAGSRVYAAKYNEDKILSDLEIFEVPGTGDISFTADFEPDKVFIWQSNMAAECAAWEK